MTTITDLVPLASTIGGGFFIGLVAGYPGHKLVFTFSSSEVGSMENMEVDMLKNNKIYFIIHFAKQANSSDYLPIVQKMIDSFEITK